MRCRGAGAEVPGQGARGDGVTGQGATGFVKNTGSQGLLGFAKNSKKKKTIITLNGFLYVDYTNCGPSKQYRLQR